MAGVRTLGAACALLPLACWSISCAPPVAVDGGPDVVVRDGTGDVWRETCCPDAKPAGALPEADMIEAAVWHEASGVMVRMRFVDLRPEAELVFGAGFTTPGGEGYGAIVRSTRWHRSGENRLMDNPDEELSCRNLRHRIDFDRDVVTLSVPAGCLNDPEWVRVFAYNELWGKGCFSCTDNAHDDLPFSENASTARIPRSE